MKIRTSTPTDLDPLIRRMADEAKLSIDDLAKIALLNLVALYVKDRGIEDTAALTDSAPELGLSVRKHLDVRSA